MVCPQCKSPDIHRDVDTKIQGALGLPSMYVCNKCGNSSHMFPEVEISEFKKFEHEVDKKHERDIKKDETPLLDTSLANITARFFLKFTGPLLLIIGLGISFRLFVPGMITFFIGTVLTYITYFKKKKIKR